MRISSILASTFGLLISTTSFSQTADLFGEKPANWHTYNENKGQLVNTDGYAEPNVAYFTEGTFPRIACWKPAPAPRAGTSPLLSFWWTDVADTAGGNDTTARIDFTVNGEGAAHNQPTAYEQASGLLNYYQAHTGSNGVKGVKRFQRIKYENIYPNVDLEIYSSEIGFKAYFVVHPGGDPNSIQGHFEGQDSITHDTVVGMRVYLRDKFIRMDHAFAYQVNGTTVTPLLWQPEFFNMGGGDFKFHNIGQYNTSETLVFQLGGGLTLGANSANTPQWCTWYGSDGEDFANDVECDNVGNTYKAGQTHSSAIPAENGELTVFSNGSGDAYVVCFDENYAIKWATTIGGVYSEGLEDIVLKVDNDDTLRIYGVGSTMGDGFPAYIPTFWQGYFEGFSLNYDSKAIIVRINAESGSNDYRSYFGGRYTRGLSIDVDSQGKIYIAGGVGTSDINENAQCLFDQANSDRFTVCDPFGGAYYQNFNGIDNTPSGQTGTSGDGYIARFDQNTFVLEYSTLLGGFRDELITDIFIDRSTDYLYFVGRTKTEFNGSPSTTCVVPSNGDFPLCDAGGNAFWQLSINGASTPGGTWDGFIGALDDNMSLIMNSYIGGNDMDGASEVYVNDDGDIYVVGWTATDDTIQIPYGSTSSSRFPVLNSGGEFSQDFGGGDFDAWLWRFNSSFEPVYGSLVGGEGDEIEYRAPSWGSSEIIRHEPSIVVSENNLVFISGFTTAPNTSSSNDFPHLYSAGLYDQFGNNDAFENDYDKSDGFLFGVDASNEQMYGSYFGGSGFGANTDDLNVGDAIDGITIFGNKIFIVGRSFSTENFPHECPQGAYCNNNPSGVVNEDHSTAYIAQLNEKLWILSDESDKVDSESSLTVYPNPFTDRIYIQLHGSTPVNYTVNDVSGKIVFKGSVRNGEGIDFSDLQNGVYLLNVQSNHSQVFKVVKQ